MGALWQDVRYGLRMLAKNPGFTVVALLSLALGIGANTAIFTLLHASLWKPLPVKDPNQIFQLLRSKPGDQPGDEHAYGYSYVLFQQLSAAAQPSGELVAKAGFALRKFGVDGDSSERVVGEAVSANFFSALRLEPVLGRVFEPQDDSVLGGNHHLVLSHALWTRRFQANPSVLGKTLLYKETPYTVIGVAQPGFTGVEAETSIDVWVPITADVPKEWLSNPQNYWLSILARLRPDSDPAQVQAALDGLFRSHLAREVLPGVPPRFKSLLEAQHLTLRHADSGLSTMGRHYQRPLLLLMAVVALVLLITCANVANLAMARNVARRHEITIRLAIGASRGRIIRQLFAESLLLALSGAVLGIILANWACRLLISLLPESRVPLAFDLRPDSTILGFTAAAAILTAALFGLLPALRACRAKAALTFKSGPHATGRSLTSRVLVAGQLALSLLLLIGAGLFLGTLRNLRAIDLGFRPQRVVTFELSVPRGTTIERVRQIYQQIQEQTGAHPGVITASYAWPGVYDKGGWSSPVEVEGQPATPGEDNEAGVIAVGPDFFETIGMALLQGRYLTPRDSTSVPAAVVNESLARYYFGNVSPIGRRIRLPGNQPELREIVGVVRDARHYGARQKAWRMVYLPGANNGTLLVRTNVDIAHLSSSIRAIVSAADSTAQIEQVRPLQAIVEGTFNRERMIATLSAAFGVLAALLACIGLYGVMAYNVSRRTTELGIRMVLGAQRSHIHWLVMRETINLVVAGSATGVAGALALNRLVSSMLFGLSPNDPLAIAAATTILFVVAAIAGYLPSRRASKIDPMVALRYE